MWDAIIEFGSRPFVGFAAGSILGVGGIILSIVFYYWTRTKTKLSYARADVVVLSVNSTWHDDLEIKYRGVIVPRITMSAVGFWNDGTETISGDQISSGDPLRLVIPEGCKILGIEVRSSTRAAINPGYKKIDDQTIAATFDFLDRGDGFIVRVAHSGEIGSLSLLGTIKGIPSGLTAWRTKRKGFAIDLMKSIASTAIIPLAFLTVLQLSVFLPENASVTVQRTFGILGIIMVSVVITAGVVFGSRWLEGLRQSVVPATLRSDPTFKATLSE